MVGRPNFWDTDERILFVGKPHRGTPGEKLPSEIIDPTDLVAGDLWQRPWPYWSYTRKIAENLYGDNASDFIAFTNLIKCTNVDADDGQPPTDRTTPEMVDCCVRRLGVIWKEVQLLKPLTIVSYTYSLFRETLQVIPVAIEGTVREISPQNHSVPCRRKQLGWWERACKSQWTDNLRILVVGHPERMAKQEFVDTLTNWLRP